MQSSSKLAAIGEEYERFVGAYYESSLANSIVIHQGAILGKKDTGIDLIVITVDTTYLIQCKYHKASSVIHSNYVSQLRGDTNVFICKYPEAKNVTPVLVAHCTFADDAIENALINKVKLKQLRYAAPYYRPGQKFVSHCPVNYELFLHALLKNKQDPEPVYSNQSLPEPDQTPYKPEQNPVEPDQTATKPDHPHIISNQPIFRDESSSASINQVLTPSEAFDNDIMASSEKMSPEEKDAVERGFFYYWWHYDSKSTVSAKNMLKNAFLKLLALSGIIAGIIIAICIFCIPVIGPAIVIIFVVALIVALRNNKPA